MKKILLPIFCLVLILVSGGITGMAYSDDNMSTDVAKPPSEEVPVPVNVNPVPYNANAEEPPPAPQRPNMVVVPAGPQGNEYVYMVTGTPGIYFSNGVWYRHWNGVWYTTPTWGSPWVSISVVPPIVMGISPWYPFYLPLGYFHIGWFDFYAHWGVWNHSHYWGRQGWFRSEMRSRNARMAQIRQDHARGTVRGMHNVKGIQNRGAYRSNRSTQGSTHGAQGSHVEHGGHGGH